jgi:hypothetical protein
VLPSTKNTHYEPDQFGSFLGTSEHEWDAIRLSRDTGPRPALWLSENLRTESDTRRYWSRYISSVFMQAFFGNPATLEEMGEQAPSAKEQETVDDSYCFLTQDWLVFAGIAEQKRSSMIRPKDWIQKRKTSSKIKLGSELRMCVPRIVY